MQLRHLFLLLFVMLAQSVAAQRGSVRGRVVHVRNQQPLVGALVQLEGKNQTVATDSLGYYALQEVPAGFYHLTVSLLGFEKKRTAELQVLGNQVTFVDVELAESDVLLSEALIRPNVSEKRAESPLSVRTIEVQQIEKSAGVNRDISKLVQTLPGVVSTAANRNDLLVRGGGPSENVFYLDGVELPVINHFSTQGAAGGVVGIINPDFVSNVDFYTGAFPANRHNALSSVMDIRMKEGSRDRLHTKISLGASDASLTIDGPLSERSTFIVSARQSYLQLLFKALDLPFLPTYNDAQLKYDFRINPRHQLSLIALGSIDRMRLNTQLAPDAEEKRRYLVNMLPIYGQWHYTIGAVMRELGEQHSDRWVVSHNALDNHNYKYTNNLETLPKLFDYQSRETEYKLRFERTQWGLPLKLQWGAGVQYARYSNATVRRRVSAGAAVEDRYTSNLDLWVYSAFVQASKGWWSERMKASFGLNLAGNTYNAAMRNPLPQLSPRLSLTYALNARTDVSANVGRYAKLPAYTTLGFRDAQGELSNRATLKYLIAEHYVAGIDHRPTDFLSFVVEAFYKRYHNYPISLSEGVSLASKGAEYSALGDEAVVASGKGRAYGVETVAKVQSSQLLFSVTYTLFRSEFTNLQGRYVPSSWDTRHMLSLMTSLQLPHRWSLAARWRWLGGAPFSPVDEKLSSRKEIWDIRNVAYPDFSRYNSQRLSAAHQLDVRIDRDFVFRSWVLNLYIDVQNVYKSANPSEPVYTNLDASGHAVTDVSDPTRYVLRPIAPASGTLLPTIGMMAKF